MMKNQTMVGKLTVKFSVNDLLRILFNLCFPICSWKQRGKKNLSQSLSRKLLERLHYTHIILIAPGWFEDP